MNSETKKHLEAMSHKCLVGLYIQKQHELEQLEKLCHELYKEYKLNAELATNYITDELYPAHLKSIIDPEEMVANIAAAYNNEIRIIEQNFVDCGYMGVIKANCEMEIDQRKRQA